MADTALHSQTPRHQTQILKEIAVDYCPDACTHCAESDSIAVTFDDRGGARWRSTTRFHYGTGNREEIHDLGFDCSDGFHEYVIKWYPHVIEWLIDGTLLRKDTKKDGEGFPEKPMFLYASVWDASYIDEGRWTGPYVGCDAPYVCHYKDVVVPSEAAVVEDFSC
ncbi:hypothetical protein C3L33_22309, partial [Rhododendron williamsianum]